MKKVIMMVAACLLSAVGVSQTTESLSIANFEITAGETTSVAVELKGGREYTAFKFDILLPEGLSIVTITEDREEYLDAKLDSSMVSTRTGHTLTAGKISETENRYRFVCVSMSNSNFRQTSSAIIKLTVMADSDVQPGEVVGKVEKTNFTTVNPILDYFFDDMTFTVTVKENTATGIDGVTADGQGVQVYNLDGRQVTAAQKGVNLVRQSDGTVRKVSVK